jgi:hypothetical protein
MSQDPFQHVHATSMAATYTAMNIASATARMLVAKGVLSRAEASAFLHGIVDELRKDTMGTPSEVPAEAVASWFEAVAKTYQQGK